ncbi:MAG: hypothetical protein SFV51_27185, partial [Bryobacteraceae bacterium]|nr:hypothetical protein [Bryobacteraceae bacterium]
MKYFLSLAALTAAIALRADISSRVRFTEAGTVVEQAFFRLMPLPGGPVAHRRPPGEARGELAKLIAAAPSQADLYSLRAQESERLLDFVAAEADWKRYAGLSQNKTRANLDLAAYYHRQWKVPQELDALAVAAAAALEADAARIYKQMLTLCERQLLPADRIEAVYRQWRTRLPKSEEPLEGAAAYLTGVKQFERAAAWIAEYERQFPRDPHFAVSARAAIAKAQGDTAAALAVYDRAFDPLWPAELMKSYFDLLRETRTTRQFLMAARARGGELSAVARVFHYYSQEGNAAAAQRTLYDFRRRREATPWTGAELRTLALLWRDTAGSTEEAARFFYALYSLPGATPQQQEEALASLAALLLTNPTNLAVASGDLTFYKDMATADAGPGLLNGILSLLLNSSEPAWQFSSQEQKAVPYFARARASELIALLEQRFPNSDRRAPLGFQLIQAYAAHGDSDAVIRSGRDFLKKFPAARERRDVSLAIADAHARKNQTQEEFAAYGRLLAELAPNTPEYSRVLDRYVSRLAVLKRQSEALALLRREIDRNPNEPTLYERLAGFLEQNKMAAQIEQVYQRATAQFQDRGWHHKLARYYLRRNQKTQFDQLTREVAKIFSGTDLETYFSQVVASANLDAVLYRQVNLYAYQRFPHNPTFVRNLLNAYQRRGTADPAAYESLLRRHWHEDDTLRARFFAHLQRTGRLNAELAGLKEQHSAARRMLAEGEAWRSHFEQAADPMAALFDESPGDIAVGRRVVDLHRSLERTAKATAYARRLTTAGPRDWEAHTILGEITSNREPFRRIAAIEPGAPEGYLEAATLHWDYYDFDGALNMIEQARKTLNNPALYAYEAGAIHENRRQMDQAIAEYLKDTESRANGRLLQLARRPSLRQAIDTATARLVEGSDPSADALGRRVSLLEAQSRKADIEALLNRLAAESRNFALLARIEEEARRLSIPGAEARSLERQIELTADPVDKLRMRLALARTLEARRDFAQAARTIDAVYRDNPMVLGVMRAAVDYHWRTRNSARALDILNAAANGAHVSRQPALLHEFARKATEAGRYAAARESLNRLLAGDPYNASYLGAMADTYSREGDTSALKSFYLEKIKLLGNRTQQVAAMRRALAGVLAGSKDYAGAMDQYIEVLNRYPEDEALTVEVALFARRHGQREKLTGHYQKTTAASPRDFRYHLVLARLHKEFEDYPAAIDAYGKAAEVRPDRTDFLQMRGEMEQRLLRFEDAARTFTRLYDLSYRNPVWMERVAELRARQNRAGDAVAALRTAFVENREDSPQAHFDAASRLESWNLMEQARSFADRGVALAGGNLLGDYFGGAETYARILTRQRQYAALSALDPEGRLLPAAAGVVAASFTAEEKQTFASFLDQRGAGPEIGGRAGMPGWQARRLHQLMMQKPGAIHQMHELVRIQRGRLAFEELAGQLEAYWGVYPNSDEKPSILEAAAEAHRAIGNEAEELRLRGLSGWTDRYLELLARRNPKRLVELAVTGPRDEAADAAIDSGRPDIALAAVRARGQGLPPVWTKAYTALTGFYLGLRTPSIDEAFRSALDSMRIGDRAGRAT